MDPKSHKIMEEMERIKKVQERIKAMTEVPASRKLVIDASAAHRMVKHELWEPNNKKGRPKKIIQIEDEDWDTPTTSNNNAKPNQESSSSSGEENEKANVT